MKLNALYTYYSLEIGIQINTINIKIVHTQYYLLNITQIFMSNTFILLFKLCQLNVLSRK